MFLGFDDLITNLVQAGFGNSDATITLGISGVGAGFTMQRMPASTSVVPDFEPLVGRRILVPQQHSAAADSATASRPQLVQW